MPPKLPLCRWVLFSSWYRECSCTSKCVTFFFTLSSSVLDWSPWSSGLELCVFYFIQVRPGRLMCHQQHEKFTLTPIVFSPKDIHVTVTLYLSLVLLLCCLSRQPGGQSEFIVSWQKYFVCCPCSQSPFWMLGVWSLTSPVLRMDAPGPRVAPFCPSQETPELKVNLQLSPCLFY